MITDFFKAKPKSPKKKQQDKGEEEEREEDDVTADMELENVNSNDSSKKKRPATAVAEDESEEKNCPEIRTKKVRKDPPSSSTGDEEQKRPSYSHLEDTLHPSWEEVLKNEFSKEYFKKLRKQLDSEEKSGAQIFPPRELVYKAFDFCHWDDLKVVIIGQDPYHDNNQAEGLCFSVPIGVKIPSSLRNILKELQSDSVVYKPPSPPHGHLGNWAKQGVLLLNTSLTVRAHSANSHKKFGWQTFTDEVIRQIAAKKKNIVFILWGSQAHKKGQMISRTKHCVIKSVHPSGLSAHRGFFGSKPFSKANAYLQEHAIRPIKWQT